MTRQELMGKVSPAAAAVLAEIEQVLSPPPQPKPQEKPLYTVEAQIVQILARHQPEIVQELNTPLFIETLGQNVSPLAILELLVKGGLDKPVSLNIKTHLKRLKPTTSAIHISDQDLMPDRIWDQIFSTCPNLREISLSPNLAKNLSRHKNDLIQKHGIKLTVHRIRQYAHYDRVQSFTSDYEAERQVFELIMVDPEKQADLVLMEKYGFPEFEYACMYYGEERMPIRQLALRLGIKTQVLTYFLIEFKGWMGIEPRSRTSELYLKIFLRKIEKYRKQELNEVEAQLARELAAAEYQVGGRLPPTSLAEKHWSIWQKLQTQFPQGVPSETDLRPGQMADVLFTLKYFQVGTYYGQKTNYAKLAQAEGVSKQAIHQRITRALHWLGIEGEE